MEENMENIFTGKTVDEAKEEGLKVLGITEEEAEIEVLEEGKRKLFGSVKARVKVVKKATDGERAANFIDGLMGILKIPAVSEVVLDGEKIEIDINTTNTSAVIGRRGEVLDAIQCIAGAVANIGREEYRRVVVDCENYRAQREEKLKNMAVAKAAKAVEKKRRVALEPMSPYERRVVHSVLSSNEEVTTVSEGKEPTRRVVIIPDTAAAEGSSTAISARASARDTAIKNSAVKGAKATEVTGATAAKGARTTVLPVLPAARLPEERSRFIWGHTSATPVPATPKMRIKSNKNFI